VRHPVHPAAAVLPRLSRFPAQDQRSVYPFFSRFEVDLSNAFFCRRCTVRLFSSGLERGTLPWFGYLFEFFCLVRPRHPLSPTAPGPYRLTGDTDLPNSFFNGTETASCVGRTAFYPSNPPGGQFGAVSTQFTGVLVDDFFWISVALL